MWKLVFILIIIGIDVLEYFLINKNDSIEFYGCKKRNLKYGLIYGIGLIIIGYVYIWYIKEIIIITFFLILYSQFLEAIQPKLFWKVIIENNMLYRKSIWSKGIPITTIKTVTDIAGEDLTIQTRKKKYPIRLSISESKRLFDRLQLKKNY